ncbi:LysE family translocator [Vibrio amylolyticus]|uniref:LysE family translocator n=1 Tax=Vibrio amylolyticus TaxID=2847292 RepID=UPI00354B1AB9
MTLDTWLVYLFAIIGLSTAPGPNGLLALTHGAMYGHRKTLFTITGGVLGFVVLLGLAMFGVSALILASAHALPVLKWIGGCYLIVLGIRIWRSPALELKATPTGKHVSQFALFRQGGLAAITNPKVLLFFGAFLPQFIDPSRSLVIQFLIMASTLAAVEFIAEYTISRVASRIRPWLEQKGKTFNRVSGGLFVFVGASLPFYK